MTSKASNEKLRKRIRTLYEQDIFKPGQERQCVGNTYWGAGHQNRYGESDKGRLSTPKQREKWLRESSELLFEAVKGSKPEDSNPFRSLDDAFSTLLRCEWRPQNAKMEDIVDHANSYLVRLSNSSTPLPDVLDRLPDRHFTDNGRKWTDLTILSETSSNLIRLVIVKAYCWLEPVGYPSSEHIISSTGQLIAICVDKARISMSTDDKIAWMLIRSFLWNFWQQFRTFHQAWTVSNEVRNGFTHGNDGVLWLRDFSVSETMTLTQHTKEAANVGKAQHLCSWAFELARTSHFCMGLDFSLLHKRWQRLMINSQTRCSNSCDGKHPHHCIRYKGLDVKPQSMHDSHCSESQSEAKLPWDAASYRNISGARAVSVDDTNPESGPLQYCEASKNTIAVSHVWSHGQGGRPDTGINRCLHRRYSEIAARYKCDSYWMDVTCIPDEHDLRKEAIGQINNVFHQSKGVLVCDIDLMTIDISDLTIEDEEAILCAVLLCDWNLRAWTLLEGLKGRANILILCKDNKTLSLSDVVHHVIEHGSLNILAIMQLLSHILPRETSAELSDNSRDYVTASTIGAWLSHRPASRPGDDVVIWSLSPAHNAKPITNAREFWLSQRYVHSGYLLSSAERLKEKGLSWAPKTPYAIPPLNKDGTVPNYYLPMLGSGTETLSIGEDGLTGNWWTHEFELNTAVPWPFKSNKTATRAQTSTQLELLKVQKQFMSTVGFAKYGALIKPVASEDVEDNAMIAIGGTLLAVCESNGRTVRSHPRISHYESYRWVWKGVYEWPHFVPLPKFDWDTFFWID